MAEMALGVVALAFPVTKLVYKISVLAEEWKEAPEDVMYMLKRAELCEATLAVFKDKIATLPAETPTIRPIRSSLDECERCCKQFYLAAKALKIKLDTQSHRGRLKVLTNKDDIQKLKARLDEAIALMDTCRGLVSLLVLATNIVSFWQLVLINIGTN